MDFFEPSINSRAFARSSGLIPAIISRYPESTVRGRLFSDMLINEVKNLLHKNTSEETIYHIVEGLMVESSENMLQRMISLPNATATWKNIVVNWNTKTSEFIKVRDILIANYIPDLLTVCDDYITHFANNNKYIAPVRAIVERYYRRQDLAVDEVDFQGQNLAVFLRNLSQTEIRNFSEWTNSHFGFIPELRMSSGHLSLVLKEKGSNEEFNLADKGFGFSQILPILTQLWAISNQRNRRTRNPRQASVPVTFAVEQPELHLHPYLQSQLIDTFIYAIKAARDLKIDLRLILETHSETFINRLGHRVHADSIAREDVNIVLFEKRRPDEPAKTRISTYDSDGFLKNWPFGFFDPAGI